MTLVVSVTGGPVSSVSGGGVTTWSKDIAKVGNQEGNDNEILVGRGQRHRGFHRHGGLWRIA